MRRSALTSNNILNILLWTVVALATTRAPALAQDSQTSQLRDEYFKGHYSQVIATSASLPAATRDNPLVCFWVGQSYLRCHDLVNAEAFLRKAAAARLGAQQRERAEAALSRIATIKQLRPPFLHDYTQNGYTIRVFAQQTPWSKDLAAQMPTFLSRAQEAFGSANASVEFYLFEDRHSYDKFFEAWGPQSEGKQHRGTGGMHMVLFCKYYPTGKLVGEKDINDLHFRLLHEYSHALCHTIYGDNFRMTQWLNEGMADYFGWKYKPTGATEATERLRKLAAGRQARSYHDISSNLYEDSETGTPLATSWSTS